MGITLHSTGRQPRFRAARHRLAYSVGRRNREQVPAKRAGFAKENRPASRRDPAAVALKLFLDGRGDKNPARQGWEKVEKAELVQILERAKCRRPLQARRASLWRSSSASLKVSTP